MAAEAYSIDDLYSTPPFSLAKEEKQAMLLQKLHELHSHHAQKPDYANLISALGLDAESTFESVADFPFLPVRLFKTEELKSIEKEEVIKVLTSSGTTGQAVSRIYLDAFTAKAQTKTLNAIVQSYIGPKRLPMLIADTADVINNRNSFSARGAGILGFMNFGADHCYMLDSQMKLNTELLLPWLAKHSGESLLIFGFTFMVWQHVVKEIKNSGLNLDLSKATLIHSGGWKKLEAEKVSNEVFKAELKAITGLNRVFNFYGMVEQVGSIFMECENGYLHTPIYADVLVRNPLDWSALPNGTSGVIEVVSVLPYSYPGHVLLTEDEGIIHGEDTCTCGRKGKYFSILGRLPQAEIRGCSDTYAQDHNQSQTAKIKAA